MYSPAHYKESDAQKIRDLIEHHPFATVLSADGAVSHLPLILEGEDLLGHMARANPQWRELESTKKAHVIFYGPHSYISPAWYNPAPDNVPTWSYAIVHARGRFEILEGERAEQTMDAMIARFEHRYGEGWSLPEERSAIHAMMNAITVFKLTNIQFEGKFKLNQMQDLEERRRVALKLKASGRDEARKLGELMERVT